MKYYFIIIVILSLGIINLRSQTSGWIIKDNIKTQILKAKNIKDICVNPEKNLIYTAHHYSNGNKQFSTIIKWNYATGEVIDSINIPKFAAVQFSTDGKYLTLIDDYLYLNKIYSTNISIYKLDEEKIIDSYLFRTPTDLNCRNNSYMYNRISFDNLDYDSYRKLLYITINFGAYTYYSNGTTGGTTTKYELGGIGVFDLKDDSLKLIKQYADYYNFNNLFIKDRVYVTTSDVYDQHSSTGSAHYTTIKNNYYLSYFDINTNKSTVVAQKYYEYKQSQTGAGGSKSEIGQNIPYNYIGFNEEMNNVLVTYANKILYYDYENDNLIDSMEFSSIQYVTSFCNKGTYALRIQSDSLFFVNIKNKNIEETMKLLFSPHKLKLILNESKLLIINYDGYFAEVEIPKCFNIIDSGNDKIDEDRISIINLNNEQLEINFEISNNETSYETIELYDILGNLLKSQSIDNLDKRQVVEIQSLHPGFYFIKIGNMIGKFTKI